MKKVNIVFILFLFYSCSSFSQFTVYFQGGEGTANDNWNFTPATNAGGTIPPGIVTALPRTGTRSIRGGGGNTSGCSSGANCISGLNPGAVGCAMHGNTTLFATVCTTAMANPQLSFYHRNNGCNGSGFDASETLIVQVSNNGGAFFTVGTLTGGGEFNWLYTTPSPGGLNNPFVYNLPAGTNTFAFRLVCNTNRSDEVFHIDDVRLTTTTAGWPYPSVNPCLAVLPIELTTFEAKYNYRNVDLNWATATEQNSDLFEVERSIDAINFETVLKVKAAGNSNTNINYKDVDKNPIQGISYYRLKQLDKDGTYKFSHTVAVNTKKEIDFSVLPNPTETGEIIINTEFLPNSNEKIEVFDYTGKFLFEQKITGNSTPIKLSEYGKGMYLFRLNSNEIFSYKKVIFN
jgi:hypothetical protein